MVAALLVLGVALRVAEFLEPSSLWGDETMLAISIASRTYGQLAEPLYFGQTAPLLYLWLERTAFELAGAHERVFRLVPFVGSVLSLGVFYAVARRMAAAGAATVALALVATSPVLVTYSGEGKPYATDFLTTTLLFLLALWWRGRPPNSRRWLALLGAGWLAILGSTPSIFVLASLVVAVWAGWTSEDRRRHTAALAAVATLWVAAFAALYLLLLGDVAANIYMQEFWERALLVPGPDLPGRFWEGLAAAAAPAGAALYPRLLTPIVLLLLAGGVVVLARGRRKPDALLLTLPLVFAFGASFLGRYPLHSRLLLYAVPGVAIACGIAVDAAAVRLAAWRAPIRPRFVVAALVLPLAIVGISVLTVPSPQYEAMAPIVAELNRRAAPEVPVYVFARNTPAWLFYTTDWDAPDLDVVQWVASRAGPEAVAHENGPTRGPRSAGEGAELVYTIGGRPVLLGVPSGSQVRARQGFVPARTDANWAANEAARIAAAAHPAAWLILSTYGESVLPECGEIVEALRHRGFSTTTVARVGTTVLARTARS